VQVALKPWNCPAVGWVTTIFSSWNVLPPPTGISEVRAKAPGGRGAGVGAGRAGTWPSRRAVVRSPSDRDPTAGVSAAGPDWGTDAGDASGARASAALLGVGRGSGPR
jgi:hypothetical protein